MLEFTVDISSRPLGVRFAHADRGETVVVHLVLEGKVGDKLGLQPGDILTAVNDTSLLDKPSSDALNMFRSQQLPFKATFRRFEEDDDLSDDESQSEQTAFMRDEASHLLSALQYTPYHKKSRVLSFLFPSRVGVTECCVCCTLLSPFPPFLLLFHNIPLYVTVVEGGRPRQESCLSHV